MTTPDTTQTAPEIHQSANVQREFEQDYPSSLASADRAMAAYAAEGNDYGISEALCSRVLTLRHMARELNNSAFLIQAHHEAMAAVEIADKAGVSTAVAHQNLGKVQKQLGMTEEAHVSFQKALKAQTSNPHPTQDRPGVLANFKEILATTELALGDNFALERAEAALSELEASDEDAYNKAVWLSHGHGRIAQALKDRDPATARKHFEIARDIIRSHPDLKLSEGKLKELEAEFEKLT